MMLPRWTWIAWLMVAGCSGPAHAPKPAPAKPEPPTPQAPPQPAPTLPIWISPTLEVHSAAEAAAKLDAEDPLGFGELVHESTTVTPKTCSERDRLKARGFEPSNTLETQTDSGAEVRCKALRLLARAQPARIRFVPSALEASVISVLPAAVASATSNDRLAQRDAAARLGQSLQQFEPRARGQTDPAGMLVIRETGFGTSVNLELQARGDFDADGAEDLAVSVLNSADHGSWTEMRLMVLTRAAPAGLLTVVP